MVINPKICRLDKLGWWLCSFSVVVLLVFSFFYTQKAQIKPLDKESIYVVKDIMIVLAMIYFFVRGYLLSPRVLHFFENKRNFLDTYFLLMSLFSYMLLESILINGMILTFWSKDIIYFVYSLVPFLLFHLLFRPIKDTPRVLPMSQPHQQQNVPHPMQRPHSM